MLQLDVDYIHWLFSPNSRVTDGRLDRKYRDHD